MSRKFDENKIIPEATKAIGFYRSPEFPHMTWGTIMQAYEMPNGGLLARLEGLPNYVQILFWLPFEQGEAMAMDLAQLIVSRRRAIAEIDSQHSHALGAIMARYREFNPKLGLKKIWARKSDRDEDGIMVCEAAIAQTRSLVVTESKCTSRFDVLLFQSPKTELWYLAEVTNGGLMGQGCSTADEVYAQASAVFHEVGIEAIRHRLESSSVCCILGQKVEPEEFWEAMAQPRTPSDRQQPQEPPEAL